MQFYVPFIVLTVVTSKTKHLMRVGLVGELLDVGVYLDCRPVTWRPAGR